MLEREICPRSKNGLLWCAAFRPAPFNLILEDQLTQGEKDDLLAFLLAP